VQWVRRQRVARKCLAMAQFAASVNAHGLMTSDLECFASSLWRPAAY